MRLRSIAFVAACLAPVAVHAGIYFESTHVSEGGPQGVHQYRIQSWAEEERTKIEFVDAAASGMMCSGCYLLTEDAGATLLLVDPSKETYSRWDLDAMLGMLGSVMDSGLINVEFSTPESEELANEPGEPILGHATTHVRWRNRYDMQLKVMGFKQKNSIEVVQDFWTTDALTDRGLNVWLRSEPPKTGNEGFDDMISAEMAKIAGLPLRSKTVTTTVNKKGKSVVTTDTMEVTKIGPLDIEAGTFTVPSHFEEVPLLPEMAGGEPGAESPMEGLRGILGRKKKD